LSIRIVLLATCLLTCDVLLTGFTVGTTVWFFFVQSPFLFQRLGREKFVPLMMPLTRLWVTTMFGSVSCLLAVGVAGPLLLVTGHDTPHTRLPLSLTGLAWLAVAVNKFIVVPKALKAGTKSHQERKGDNSKDVKSFVVQGGSQTQTKAWHQSVVVFVLVMAGALVAHTVAVCASLT
jgi:hypothetical protein